MAAKRKLNLDLDKITSGLDLKNTVQKVDATDNPKTDEIQELRTFKKVQFKKLKSSPLNDYPIVDVEEMENLLLAYGLLEPLSVSYIEDEDTYEIESGDRRFHALQNLYTKYESENETENRALYEKNIKPIFVNGIHCMIENGAQDKDSKRTRIIIHNESHRPFDPIRTSARLVELAQIYSRQNSALPSGERINVNEKIAKDLNGKYGVRQIIRYKNFDSLIEPLKNVAVKYDMNIATMSTYHTLSELEQSVLAKYIEDGSSADNMVKLPSIDEIKSIVAEQSDSGREDSEISHSEPSNIEAATNEVEATTDPLPSGPMDPLSSLKDRAAKKILEEMDKRENKIKTTLDTLQKKTIQLEKIISSMTEDDADTQDVDQIIAHIDNITAKLNTLKSSLQQ